MTPAPAYLPSVVDIAGGIIRLDHAPGPDVAAAACIHPRIVIETLADPGDWASLTRAVHDPDQADVDWPQVAAAGAGITARLCGMEATMTGWRMATRLCSVLIGDPPSGWALVADRGIDPSTAPLWVSCAAVYAAAVKGKKSSDVDQLKRDLTAPLPGESSWSHAMPKQHKNVEDRRSRAARERRATKNVRAVRALRSGQLR